MVPIHDTDLAEERFAQAEWENYELWEKVEVRLRRRKWIWILGAATLFVLFSSVPILIERAPKWRAMAATRRLAQQITWLKKQAAVDHVSHRIRFLEDNGVEFVVEKANHCTDANWTFVKSGGLIPGPFAGDFHVLSAAEGKSLGAPGLLQTFCYDALEGAGVDPASGLAGIGILPVKDLTELRSDRLSVLLITGASAELSFD